MTVRRPALSCRDIAIAIVDGVNVYGRETNLRYGNETRLINAIATALQMERAAVAAGDGERASPAKEG
jgi:hypothetical protein